MEQQSTIQAILAEYSALREEIQNSIRLQHATFSVGVPLLAVGLSLSQLNQLGSDTKALQFIVLAIPPFAYAILCLWLIEMSRMMRAGNYLRLLEDRLNIMLQNTGLVWENWLRLQVPINFFDPHTIHHWVQWFLSSIILAIAVIAIFTIGVGEQTFVLDKWIFVISYSLFGCVLLVLGFPIVSHKRTITVGYLPGPTQGSKEFRDWLHRYQNDLNT